MSCVKGKADEVSLSIRQLGNYRLNKFNTATTVQSTNVRADLLHLCFTFSCILFLFLIAS